MPGGGLFLGKNPRGQAIPEGNPLGMHPPKVPNAELPGVWFSRYFRISLADAFFLCQIYRHTEFDLRSIGRFFVYKERGTHNMSFSGLKWFSGKKDAKEEAQRLVLEEFHNIKKLLRKQAVND